jgi:hypothetical protein
MNYYIISSWLWDVVKQVLKPKWENV